MDIVLNKTPWAHGLINYTYELTKFQKARDELILKIPNITWENSYRKTPISLTINEKLFPFTFELVNGLNLFGLFNAVKHFFNPREHSKIKEVTMISSCSEYPHDIHDETSSKIFSLVTYIAPKHSCGTFLYDRNKNKVKEIEWVPNRSMFFCGEKDVTWHSYTAGYSPRITLTRFLEIF